MRRVFVLLLLVFGLSLVFWVSPRRHTASAPMVETAVLVPEKPKQPLWLKRNTQNQNPNRFDQLDPELRPLALRLETAAIEFEAESERGGIARFDDRLWRRKSIEDISQLKTPEVVALANWTAIIPWSDARLYRAALYIVWGSRDIASARAEILQRYEGLGNKQSGLTFNNNPLDWTSDDFHHIRVGQSMTDPEGAWQAFLEDEKEGGDAQKLNDSNTTPRDVFENYARRNPEEVLKLYFAAPEGKYSGSMLDGFVKGAPPSQSWRDIARRLLDEPHEDDDYHHSPLTVIAARWLRDDPGAALDWYAEHASYDLFIQAMNNRGYADKVQPLSAADVGGRAEALKLHVLDHVVNDERGANIGDAVSALDYLLSSGRPEDEELARQALNDFSESRWLYPSFLPTVAKIKGAAAREDLLLKFMEHLPEGSRDNGDALPYPNPYLAPTRSLIASMQLSATTSEKVDAIFKETEALEEENRHALPHP